MECLAVDRKLFNKTKLGLATFASCRMPGCCFISEGYTCVLVSLNVHVESFDVPG